MSDYRRWRVAGSMVFITMVTYGRRPVLNTPIGRRLLRHAIEETRLSRPFELFAGVLLPDHCHYVMQLPAGDADYSRRIGRIKELFTKAWLEADQAEADVTRSQRARGERGVWQPRFWEHTVRDDEDLSRCVDYIHWNPQKHGLVTRVKDYPWSSFHRFVRAGDYDPDWGGTKLDSEPSGEDWGEPS